MTSKTPHITANALIRYCEAKAPQRTRIIEEFRDGDFPPFKGWYGETEGAVRRYVLSGGTDDGALSDLEAVLERRPIDTDFEESRVLKQLEALQATRETSFAKVAAAGTISLIEDRVAPFFVEGVRISVRPTNLLSTMKLGFKSPFLGVVKPYLSSSSPLSPDGASIYGALLHWYAESQLGHMGDADPTLCFVVDVFRRRVFRAPKAFKQRRDLISYSCREIAERWTSASRSVALPLAK
ncbi:MAG: hypothetical protein ACTHLT_20165 [Devosia sp.]